MTLDQILTTRRPIVLRQWLDVIRALFPPAATRYLEEDRDPCTNPVGETMREAAEALYDRLGHDPSGEACPPLERLMRLLAVQGITPSHAVGFLLALKRLLRAELLARLDGPALVASCETIDDRIDHLTLEAVDLFAAYREQLSVLQVNEAQRSTRKLLECLQRARDDGEENS